MWWSGELMYYIWRTGHHINQTVSDAIHAGLQGSIVKDTSQRHNYFQSPRKIPAIGYGILRGTAEVFWHNREHGVDFVEFDRGYLKPQHFDGYYRISKNGLQAKYHEHEYPFDRLNKLHINLQRNFNPKGHILVCPPTDFIQWFYGLSGWEDKIEAILKNNTTRHVKVRRKNDVTPLENDLTDCYCVVTFNSNVAIDAILRGIPVVVSEFSVCHGWTPYKLQDIIDDKLEAPKEADILELLSFASYQQFTLEEIKQGLPWKIISI